MSNTFEKYNTEWITFNDEFNAIRKKYRICETIHGETIERNPPSPNNTLEALELLKNYYGALQFVINKIMFFEKYRTLNDAAVNSEQKEMQNWIDTAEQINYSEAVIDNVYGSIKNANSAQHEYLRLKHGFYESYLLDEMQLQETSLTASVYGKYFLFKSYLDELQQETEVLKPIYETAPGFTKDVELLNNNLDNVIPADFFMAAVQLYSSMVDNAAQKRRTNSKVQYTANGLLSEITEQLQNRQPNIDVQSLFHSLHYLLAWKTFDDISEGQTVVQELQTLNIEVPALVQNCLKEIEMRSRKVKEYAAGKHQWTEEKIENWKDEIESKLLAYTYDNSSRKNHIVGLFTDAVSEIKKLESEAIAKYGYHIDGFYKAGKFVATETDLNNLFFHGETFAGGYTAFHNIYLLLMKYIDKHNEVTLLKSLINSNPASDTASITDGGEDYIKPELLRRLKEIESKIQSQLKSWPLIKRAAWVELLKDKGYFLPEYKRQWRKNCTAFAKARYRTDIENQLLTKENEGRESHKEQLLKYFK